MPSHDDQRDGPELPGAVVDDAQAPSRWQAPSSNHLRPQFLQASKGARGKNADSSADVRSVGVRGADGPGGRDAPDGDGRRGGDASSGASAPHLSLTVASPACGATSWDLGGSTYRFDDRVMLWATGGDGGNGGGGGRGHRGAPGSDGRDATQHSAGTDGGPGGPGGPGGDGGRGGDGGHGGHVGLTTDDESSFMLMLFPQTLTRGLMDAAVRGGRAGAGGSGGQGGPGGPGGRGGSAHHWTTTTTNAEGKSVVHHHSKPGGSNGRQGPSGPNGSRGGSGAPGQNGVFQLIVDGKDVEQRYDLELDSFDLDGVVAGGLFEFGETVLCNGLQVRNAGRMITPRQSIEVCLEQTRELTPIAPANDEGHSAFIDTRLSPGESLKPEKILHFAIAYPQTLPPLDAKPLTTVVEVSPKAYQRGSHGGGARHGLGNASGSSDQDGGFRVRYANFDNPLTLTARYPVQERPVDAVRVLGKGERALAKAVVQNIARGRMGRDHGRRVQILVDVQEADKSRSRPGIQTPGEFLRIRDGADQPSSVPLVIDLPDLPSMGTDSAQLQVGWSEDTPDFTQVVLITSLLLEPIDKGERVPGFTRSHGGSVVAQRCSTKFTCMPDFEVPSNLDACIGCAVLVVSSEVPGFVVEGWKAWAEELRLGAAVWSAGRYGHVDPSTREDFARLARERPCVVVVLDGAVEVREHAGSVAQLLDPAKLARCFGDAKVLLVSPGEQSLLVDGLRVRAPAVGTAQSTSDPASGIAAPGERPEATCELRGALASGLQGSARVAVPVSSASCCQDATVVHERATQKAAAGVARAVPTGRGAIVRRVMSENGRAMIDVHHDGADEPPLEVFHRDLEPERSCLEPNTCRWNLAMALPDAVLVDLFWSLFGLEGAWQLPSVSGPALRGAALWRLFREVRTDEDAAQTFLHGLLDKAPTECGLPDVGPAKPQVIEFQEGAGKFQLSQVVPAGRDEIDCVVDTPVGLCRFHGGECQLPCDSIQVLGAWSFLDKLFFAIMCVLTLGLWACFCDTSKVRARVLVLEQDVAEQTAFALDSARVMVLAIRHCRRKIKTQKQTKELLKSLEDKFMLQLPASRLPGGDVEAFLKRRASNLHGARKLHGSLEEYWTSLRGWWGSFYAEPMKLSDSEARRAFMSAPKSGWSVFSEEHWGEILKAKASSARFRHGFQAENDAQRAELVVTSATRFQPCSRGCGRAIPVHIAERHENWECRLRPQGLDFLLEMTKQTASLAMLTDENIQLLADACDKRGILEDQEHARISELVTYLRSEFRLQQLMEKEPEDVFYKEFMDTIDQTRLRSADRGEAGLVLPKASAHLCKVLAANLRSALKEGSRENSYEIADTAIAEAADIDFAMPELRSFAKQDLAEAKTVTELVVGMRRCLGYGVPAAELTEYEAQLRSLKRLPDNWDITEFVKQEDIDCLTRKIDDSDPQTLARFQYLLDQTFKRKYTRDRKGGKVPHKLLVRKVTKVMNANVWQDYVCRRETVLFKDGWYAKKKQALIGMPKDVHPPITRGWYEDTRTSGADPDLRDDLNEQWLFHGTSKAGADGITSQDFRLDLAGTSAGTLYGRGVYLAECCSKSDEYTSVDESTGLRPLLLCRATLGNVLYTAERTPDVHKLELQCGLGKASSLTSYRSVLGDREKASGTFREFIIYDSDLVYPAYVIWYERQV